MPIYSTHQAKTHLSELIRMVERGEIITITRGTIPVALLVRVGAVPQARRSGTLATTMRLDPTLDFRDGPPRERSDRPNRPAPPQDPDAGAADIGGIDIAGIDIAGIDIAGTDTPGIDTAAAGIAATDNAPTSASRASST